MKDSPVYLTSNHILLSLKGEDRERVTAKLERVTLPHGEILYQADEKISHVYFPDRAMISVVAYTEEGQAAEVAVIGFEGVTGVEVVMGGDKSSNQCITQLPNGGTRMRTADVRAEFARGGALQALMLKFARKLMLQISQTALCNRLHSTEQRLSRWLLMCHDRHHSDKLNITQEFLGVMLGTSRTSVSLTANVLQQAGLISYSRGVVTIVDRPGLEEFACSCYKVIRKAYWSDPAGRKS